MPFTKYGRQTGEQYMSWDLIRDTYNLNFVDGGMDELNVSGLLHRGWDQKNSKF